MRDIADRVMDAAPITETDVEAGTTSVDEVGSRNPTSGRAGIDFIKSSGERVVKVAEKSGDGCDKDPVLRSAVMLTFGAELPRSAATACDRPQQLPFRDDWDDPEVMYEKTMQTRLLTTKFGHDQMMLLKLIRSRTL